MKVWVTVAYAINECKILGVFQSEDAAYGKPLMDLMGTDFDFGHWLIKVEEMEVR